MPSLVCKKQQAKRSSSAAETLPESLALVKGVPIVDECVGGVRVEFAVVC